MKDFQSIRVPLDRKRSSRLFAAALVTMMAFMRLPVGNSFAPTYLFSSRDLRVTGSPTKTTVPPNTISNSRRNTSSSLTFVGLNPLVASAVGHVIGGNLAVPFVIHAVKTWYAKIPLPSWTPPNGIFAPTWICLYSSLGVAVARVAAASAKGWKSLPVVLWAAHYLLLNLSWAPLFFGMAKLRAALLVNYAMVASLPPLFVMFAAVDRTASLLLLPYTGWLVFATILNQSICKLNPMDGNGYSNALFEADLANLQREAAKFAGL